MNMKFVGLVRRLAATGLGRLGLFFVAAFAMVAVSGGVLHAQGSRKDDIVFNAQGRPMAGAGVRICTASATGQPCSPVALIYSDAALTQALANPMTADGLGNYTFYAAPGRYEIEISGPGIITKQLPNVILPSDPSAPTFTTVTTTSGISAFSLTLSGNLTVSGSAAVSGSFTVGGAPVPSTAGDNQWTAPQRFKGPVPYRDFTAYMPPGGCSFPNDTPSYGATGTISSTSNTLNLVADGAADWTNGCGITISHAGPTSTITAPACPSVASAGRSGNVVTVTCAANTNLVWNNTGGANGQDQGVVISGCSDSTYNGTFVMQTNNPTTQFTYVAAGSNGSATGCAVSFYFGFPHGVTGSTTYYYKLAPVDAGGGMSAAITVPPITNGNATLSVNNGNMNFNTIFFPFVVNSKMTAVWRSLDNTTWTCAGMAFAISFQDWGYNGPCPDLVPAAPPASPTAQSLTTTIVSGAGTTTLTVAASASNTATTQHIYHDEMPFLTQCVNDANNDQTPGHQVNNGSFGCYIPAGTYMMNSEFPTDLSTAPHGGLQIEVAGTVYMGQWPWMIKSGYSVRGVGYSGGVTNSSNYPTTATARDIHQPAAFVIHGSGVSLDGFQMAGAEGFGIYAGIASDGLGGVSGLKLHHLIIANASDSSGVPLVVGGDTFKIEADDINFAPRSDGFPASVLFTTDSYMGLGGADHEFDHAAFLWHHYFVSAPGGQQGEGFSWNTNTMWSEEHGQYPTGGFVTVDTGDASHMGTRIAGVGLMAMQNADASNKTLLYVLGSNAATVPFGLLGTDAFAPLVACAPLATACQAGLVNAPMTTLSAENPWNGKGQVGPMSNGSAYLIGLPTTFASAKGDWGNGPPSPFIADALPAPSVISVTGTGSGSLAAGTYCMKVVGLDFQSTPGTTLPSPEICQTVGASSSISLQWLNVTFNSYMYSDYRVYYASSPGGAYSNYVDTAIAPSSGFTITYTFTSTSGAVTANIPTLPTAYMSWLYRDASKPGCIYCISGSNSALWQLGIGEPSPPSGDKLSVKGGVLDAESGFKTALATKSSNYTLTTADYWVNVTGTTTITVPHSTTGNHWVVFNSGSNTVTVQADSGNINGGANITLSANTGKEVICDGTNCFAH